MQIIRTDVLVVGGGLEGALLALKLQRSGQQVLLVDRGRPRAPDAPYDTWLCSPFLYSPDRWSDLQASLAEWDEWGALHWAPGCALAPRESNSYGRLQDDQAPRRVKARELHQDEFPELRLDSGLGTFAWDRLPFLKVDAVTARIWQQLQKEGGKIYADTTITQVDWEHEWPTAIGGSNIFRARRLFLVNGSGVPPLLKQPLPEFKQRRVWIEGQPLSDCKLNLERPCLWVHYAHLPLYLVARGVRWGLGRLGDGSQEAEELQFLQKAMAQWLRCPLGQQAIFQLQVDGLADGQPALDYHPWRKDCLWLAGWGQTHWPWAPAMLERLCDPQQALEPDLSPRRFDPPEPARDDRPGQKPEAGAPQKSALV